MVNLNKYVDSVMGIRQVSENSRYFNYRYADTITDRFWPTARISESTRFSPDD